MLWCVFALNAKQRIATDGKDSRDTALLSLPSVCASLLFTVEFTGSKVVEKEEEKEKQQCTVRDNTAQDEMKAPHNKYTALKCTVLK